MHQIPNLLNHKKKYPNKNKINYQEIKKKKGITHFRLGICDLYGIWSMVIKGKTNILIRCVAEFASGDWYHCQLAFKEGIKKTHTHTDMH